MQPSKAFDQSNLYFRRPGRYLKGVNQSGRTRRAPGATRLPGPQAGRPAGRQAGFTTELPSGGARSAFRLQIHILAGGRSSRMGRDKARLRVGGKPLLGHVRSVAKETGWPVRVIRRDAVVSCGPLGGVYTALAKSRAEAHVFLACDMPFVSADLLKALVARLGSRQRGVFASLDGTAGFPFCIRTTALRVVEKQMRTRQFSLQSLARALKAKLFLIPKHRVSELFNINTPRDWLAARRRAARK